MSAAVKAALAATGIAIIAALGAQSVSAIANSAKAVIDLGEKMANAGKRAGIAAGQFYLFNAAVEKGLGMKTVAGLIGENAEVLNRSANVFRDVAIKLWVVGEKVRGFWLGLMDRLAPVLSRILDGALAASLVSAGQWFGDKIGEAVGLVYNLAQDGTLWTTLKQGLEIAFNYAGERLLWLAKAGYEVLKTAFSSAFSSGVSSGLEEAGKAVSSFFADFSAVVGNMLLRAFTNVFALVNKALDAIDKAIKFLNGGDKGDTSKLAAERKQARDGIVSALKIVVDKGPGSQDSPERKNIVDRISEIFDGFSFTPSEGLAKTISDFTSKIAGALPSVKSPSLSTPATKFENNTRVAAFGADSLTSIGGGGGVYLGLSVLDVNKMQLSELKQINQRLGNLGGNTSVNVTNVANAPTNVSRAQTSSPVK